MVLQKWLKSFQEVTDLYIKRTDFLNYIKINIPKHLTTPVFICIFGLKKFKINRKFYENI